MNFIFRGKFLRKHTIGQVLFRVSQLVQYYCRLNNDSVTFLRNFIRKFHHFFRKFANKFNTFVNSAHIFSFFIKKFIVSFQYALAELSPIWFSNSYRYMICRISLDYGIRLNPGFLSNKFLTILFRNTCKKLLVPGFDRASRLVST